MRQKAVNERMNLAAFMIQRAWRNSQDTSMSFIKVLQMLSKGRVKLQAAFRNMLVRKPLYDRIIEAKMKASFSYFNNMREQLEKDAVNKIWRMFLNFKRRREQARKARRSKQNTRQSNNRGLRGSTNLTRKDSNVSVASIASRTAAAGRKSVVVNALNKTLKSPVSATKK